MKSKAFDLSIDKLESLPARGVWVEITISTLALILLSCHSPHGECGLKSDLVLDNLYLVGSLPARGVWVEINYFLGDEMPDGVTPRTGSVG